MMNNLAAMQDSTPGRLLEDDAGIEPEGIDSESVRTARLAGHSHVYRARLVDALEANYPALAAMLGAADFGALGAAYVDAHPWRVYSIRWYGDALPQFLSSHPAYAGAPMLADLARWEWAMTEACDAADAEPIGAEALASVPTEAWGELRFGLHPSVRTLELLWNAPQIWTALAGDGRPEEPIDAECMWPAPMPSAQPQSWLLWRRDVKVAFRSLEPFEATALEHCRRGRRFGELCELACEWVAEQEAPLRMAEMLREWLASGLIVRAQLR